MKEIFQDQDDDDSTRDIELKINQKYADKYLKTKKSEEATSLKRKYSGFEEEESSEDEEDEDEIGDLLTPELDLQIEKTISLLRQKDPSIYDEKKTFFEEPDEIVIDKPTPEKPFTIKDYHRRELLNGPTESSSLPIVEQDKLLSEQVKKAFAEAVDEDSDQELLTKVESKSIKSAKNDLSSKVEIGNNDDENERFLREYLNSKKWMEQENKDDPRLELIEMSDEERGIEATESFEASYNFRYEEQGAETLVSHARDIPSSLRRKDDKRKRMREKKNAKKEAEKLKKDEELKRLKNLKKEEIMERLKKIEEVSGTKVNDLEEFLARDFDPNDFDNQMGNKFGQDYYNQKEKSLHHMDKIDQEDLSFDLSQDLAPDTENIPLLKENIEKKKQSLLDDLYALDYEDIIGDLPVRFKYRSVEANSYGLNPKEILLAEDKELNEFLSLKKLAPYRAPEKLKKDSKSWKKHGKSKLSEFKANLKKKKSSTSSEHVEVDARLASYNL